MGKSLCLFDNMNKSEQQPGNFSNESPSEEFRCRLGDLLLGFGTEALLRDLQLNARR